MTDLLILHLVLAFTVGGAWVSFATLIAERYGSALGGLVGGLPAISIVSFLFIGLNQGPATASQATAVFPLALSFTMSFLANSIQGASRRKHRRSGCFVKPARRPRAGRHSFIVPCNIQPNPVFHLQNSRNGAVAGIDETVVDIRGINRFSLQPSCRVPLSYSGRRAWNCGRIAMLCPLGCISPLPDQYQEDLRLVKSVLARNGMSRACVRLALGRRLLQFNIILPIA